MKPSNLKDKNCTSSSSDCVIWDGPMISCIDLCPGDSITRVVYLLAKEVCVLKEVTDISNYPVQCLNTVGPVEDFKGLINALITKVCSLEP